MCQVILTRAAERDVEDVYDYLIEKEGAERAKRVVGEILAATANLARMPDRGHIPSEQRPSSRTHIREIVINGFRVIYEIIDATVLVIVVAHHRRNMRVLLERRLDS